MRRLLWRFVAAILLLLVTSPAICAHCSTQETRMSETLSVASLAKRFFGFAGSLLFSTLLSGYDGSFVSRK